VGEGVGSAKGRMANCYLGAGQFLNDVGMVSSPPQANTVSLPDATAKRAWIVAS